MRKFVYLVVVVSLSLIILITLISQPKSDQLINPFLGIIKVTENKPSLKTVVDQALEGTKGKYAVVVENFKTGEKYSLRENEIFEPGSLYKIWLMATVFQQIKMDELEETDILSQDIKVLNEKFEIDEETAELTEGSIEMSVSSALSQMISISHNYAALLLAEKVGNSKISQFLKDYGFIHSALGRPPKTSALDIDLFFEKLYKGEIIDKTSSDKMIALLKTQQLNDGLPKFLPKSIEIAHKTGDIDYFKHDAGIVFSPMGDYIIVVLSESDFPPGAQERIAIISQSVFYYFTKNN